MALRIVWQYVVEAGEAFLWAIESQITNTRSVSARKSFDLVGKSTSFQADLHKFTPDGMQGGLFGR